MNGSKNFLIIGGTSGIGLSLSLLLTQSGHHVFSISRRDTHPNSQVVHIAADVLNDDLSTITLPDQLDGLVYCPGNIVLKPFNRLSRDDFFNAYELNVYGAIRAIQTWLPKLKQAEFASILLFSTVAAQTGMPFHAAIASAKAAVEGLARSLAAELAPRIAVNAIAPSLTDTPLAAALLSTAEKRETSAKRHPMQTVGTAEQLAETAQFLLTENRWITGQIIGIDGGMSSVRLL
jgi:3-oxoacyl-[acyl-carrier protein] reductase